MKRFLILALAATWIAAASCARIDSGRDTSAVDSRVVTVKVASDSFITAPSTKVASDNEGNFVWEEGDAIGVWTGSQITKFILSSAPGSSSGEFTATLSGSEAVDANSYAVYPYGSITVDGTTININTGRTYWSAPRRFVPMFAKAGTGHTTGFSFKMLGATVKFSVYNIPSDWKWIYFENYGTSPFNIFPDATATAVTTDAEPTMSGNHTGGWSVVLPDNASSLEKVDFYLPLLPGEYSNEVLFKFKPQTTLEAWSDVDNSLRRTGKFTNITNLRRAQLLIVPDLVYPKDVAGGISATIEEGATWHEGTTINLFNTTVADVFSLDAASAGQTTGTFSGTLTKKLNFAVSSTGSSSISVAGTTLTVNNNQWDYPVRYALYGKAEEASGFIANYPMKHLGATVRITVNNISASTKYLFMECGGRPFFYFNGTADLSEATPVITSTSTNEWIVVALPDHNAAIPSMTFDIPILTGAYDNPPWGFAVEGHSEASLSQETATTDKPRDYSMVTGGTINRGDIFNLNVTLANK